jgi:hypothetical protein
VVEPPAKIVLARLNDHTYSHWQGFASIIISADFVLALVLFGRVLDGGLRTEVGYDSAGIAVASTLAVILAYYSIQVGSVLWVEPLKLPTVLVSSVIAVTQLSLFLWPTHVLSVGASPSQRLRGLADWLVFFALFAFAASIAGLFALAARRRSGLLGVSKSYERGQQFDRWAAAGFGVAILICRVLCQWWLSIALPAGVALAIVGTVAGMISNSHVASNLQDELENPQPKAAPGPTPSPTL